MKNRFFFSILIMCSAVICVAGTYGDLYQRLKNSKSPSQQIELLESSQEIRNDDQLLYKLHEVEKSPSSKKKLKIDELANSVYLRSLAEDRSTSQKSADLKTQVEAIKKSQSYAEVDNQSDSNWMNRIFAGLHFPKFGRRPKSNIRFPFAGLQFITYFVWGIIGLLVICFVIWAARHFASLKKKKVKKVAILDAEEILSTREGWLSRALEYEKEFKYREAIRCLYIACLIRFDEGNIARFNRTETNWQHLSRIQLSPDLPKEIDFRPTTQLFDLAWYGYKNATLESTSRIKSFYKDLDLSLSSSNKSVEVGV